MYSTQYNKDYHLNWAWSLYVRGATDEEVASAFHVSKRTILRWAKKYKEFGEIRAESKEKADAEVEKSLYKRALGISYKTSKTITNIDENGQPSISQMITQEHYEPPDTGAIAFWLKNRNPGAWRDRREPEPDAEIMKKTDEILVKIQQVANAPQEDSSENDKEATAQEE